MSRWQIRRAARALRRGGVVAYPTETVYGLGCDPLDPLAVARLLRLKRRPVEKGLIVIGATLDQLRPLVAPDDPQRLQLLAQPQERPTTYLVPASADCPVWLTGAHATLAVRLTRHPLARALCLAFGGAIVSTSANPAGRPPARDPLALRRYFGDRLDATLHARPAVDARPSRIVDLASGAVLRD